MPKVVLRELKKYKVDIVSVTSMVDSGGSTGALRKELNILPPGDIRRHVLALSEAEEWKKKLWEFKFATDVVFEGGHRGHNFANLFISGLEYVLRDYERVLEILHEFMKVKGKCLPATLENTQLCAELENGEVIEGEDEIDVPKRHDGNLKIKRIFLRPKVRAYDKVLEEIEKADAIIIGPGDLYSSLLPCFLPQGIKEALRSTRAKKIFICPAMTKFGETQGFSVEEFTNEVEKYLGCGLDYVVFNTALPDEERVKKYKKQNPLLVEPVRFNKNLSQPKFVGRNLLLEGGAIEYSGEKVVGTIMSLVKQ